MIPDFTNAPEWANYVAMDEDGRWYWHAQMPALAQVGGSGLRYWSVPEPTAKVELVKQNPVVHKPKAILDKFDYFGDKT